MAPPKTVTDLSEPLVRFLFDGHFRKDMTVRWQAFKPSREDNKTSIFLTRDMLEEGVWALGAEVASAGTRQLKGRTDFQNRHVTAVGLFVELDPPPEQHACICGWPSVEDEPDVMRIAQDLAASSSKMKRPP